MIKNNSIRKRFTKDRNADILGMPLALFITIIVAVLALGILISWFALIGDTPDTIDKISVNSGQADPTKITVSPTDRSLPGEATVNLIITVWADDSKLEGATVTLSGSGTEISIPSDTVAGGTVTFNNLLVTLAPGQATGKITVKCEKQDFTSFTGQILVVRG